MKIFITPGPDTLKCQILPKMTKFKILLKLFLFTPYLYYVPNMNTKFEKNPSDTL